jgi:hypothetical protein
MVCKRRLVAPNRRIASLYRQRTFHRHRLAVTSVKLAGRSLAVRRISVRTLLVVELGAQ